MAKFIEVHSTTEQPTLLNIDHVEMLVEDGSGCIVYTVENDCVHLKESYSQVKLMISSAQGGIPMEPGRNY